MELSDKAVDSYGSTSSGTGTKLGNIMGIVYMLIYITVFSM